MPRYTKPKRTLQYTTEFKVKAVQLSLHEEVKVNSVAVKLDTHELNSSIQKINIIWGQSEIPPLFRTLN